MSKPRICKTALPQTALLVAIFFCAYGLLFSGAAAGQSSETVRVILETYKEFISPSASDDDVDRQEEIISEVVDIVKEGYVNEISGERLSEGAIRGMTNAGFEPRNADLKKLTNAALKGMLTSLDPHSSYLTPEQLHNVQIHTTGEFGGLGIEVSMKEGVVKVVTPLDDTPAYRAGIRAGDLITHIDGEPIQGKTLSQAVNKMRGSVGTQVTLTIRRSDQSPFDVSITRGKIKIIPVRSRFEGDYGYLRITAFTQKTQSALETAIDTLWAKRGRRLRGFVLDLRNNPGGLLDQAVSVSDSFLERGTVVSTRSRIKRQDQTYSAGPGDLAKGLPIVILVNGGSASGAEIVTGALQDYRRALVFGRNTFGKGSVQTIIILKKGGAVKLTTALYYTPLGRLLQGQGIVPDVSIVGSEGKASTTRRRESELTGALPSGGDISAASGTEIMEKKCPVAGDKDDRILGCALAYLRSGNMANFLASLKGEAEDAPVPLAAADSKVWEEIKYSNRISDFQRYLEQFPKGLFAQLAEKQIRNLVSQQTNARENDGELTSGIDFGHYHALVIGIDDYKHLTKLKTAINDARAVAKVLEQDYSFRVTLLENPDRTDILDTLDKYRETLAFGDNLLIYYAGHGWLDEASDRCYWLPVNARANHRSRWLSNADITDTLKSLKAKHVMVVADSCYSGTLTRAAAGGFRDKDYLRRMAAKQARVALVSGGLEPVADEGAGSHSPFAKSFLDALKKNENIIDGTRLFGEIRRPVILNTQQTPRYSDVRNAGHDGGDFLFVRKR